MEQSRARERESRGQGEERREAGVTEKLRKGVGMRLAHRPKQATQRPHPPNAAPLWPAAARLLAVRCHHPALGCLAFWRDA